VSSIETFEPEVNKDRGPCVLIAIRCSIFNLENDLRHLRGARTTDYGHVAMNGPRQTEPCLGADDGLQ
jgi:hypothetical protein